MSAQGAANADQSQTRALAAFACRLDRHPLGDTVLADIAGARRPHC
jgi:hypothetical protein